MIRLSEYENCLVTVTVTSQSLPLYSTFTERCTPVTIKFILGKIVELQFSGTYGRQPTNGSSSRYPLYHLHFPPRPSSGEMSLCKLYDRILFCNNINIKEESISPSLISSCWSWTIF